MESIARAKYLRGSAQKFRLVADLVRKKPVPKVIALLHEGLTKKAADEIEKVVRAAVANLQSTEKGANVDIDDLIVKSIMIDIGPMLKRIRPRSQGRAYRRIHRMCHITVTVSD